MTRNLIAISVVALLAFSLVGCAMFSSSSSEAPGCETCATGLGGENVFCDDCNHGFVDGLKVTDCQGCFVAKTGGPACAECSK